MILSDGASGLATLPQGSVLVHGDVTSGLFFFLKIKKPDVLGLISCLGDYGNIDRII